MHQVRMRHALPQWLRLRHLPSRSRRHDAWVWTQAPKGGVAKQSSTIGANSAEQSRNVDVLYNAVQLQASLTALHRKACRHSTLVKVLPCPDGRLYALLWKV